MGPGLRIFGWVFILLLLWSCEQAADLGLDTPEPRLVVIGVFAPEEGLKVEVSSTRSALADATTTYLLNARVELFQGNALIERLEPADVQAGRTPFYISKNFRPIAGTEYVLKVQAPGFKPVEAQSAAPVLVRLNTAEAALVGRKPSEESGMDDCTYEFRIGFQDPAQQKNYYHAHFYLFTQPETGNNGNTSGGQPEVRRVIFGNGLNTNYQIAHYDGGLLLDDQPFGGKYHTLRIPVTLRMRNDQQAPTTMVAELRSLSPEYFQFYSAVNRQRGNPGLPFAEPVILFSNVKNGAGVFAGYHAHFLGAAVQY